MPFITEELLRKRAEHNEGELSTLREVTLHQFELERITVVGDVCRQLEILYLQNNLIPKIENLHHLKNLRYLNLAVNSVTKIENVAPLESLAKLDLTCNYVTDLLSIEELRANYNLRQLFLIGNPCTAEDGYRLFIIHSLPQLQSLDGQDITRTERIQAAQSYADVRRRLVEKAREEGRQVADEPIPLKTGPLEEDPDADATGKREASAVKYDEKGNRLYGNTPEERLAAYRDLQKTREPERSVDVSGIGEAERVVSDAAKSAKMRGPSNPEEQVEKYGRVLQRNDGEWVFTFSLIGDLPAEAAAVREDGGADEEDEAAIGEGKGRRAGALDALDAALDKESGSQSKTRGSKKAAKVVGKESEPSLVLDVALGKFIDSSLVDMDVNPTYVRIVVKKKQTLQLVLPEEVCSDRSSAQRSQATGNLRIVMPLANPVKAAARLRGDMAILDNGFGTDQDLVLLTSDPEKLKKIKEERIRRDKLEQKEKKEQMRERRETGDLSDSVLGSASTKHSLFSVGMNDGQQSQHATGPPVAGRRHFKSGISPLRVSEKVDSTNGRVSAGGGDGDDDDDDDLPPLE
eukprot:ANDGO_02901.mRNA.1 Protein tilB homolog